MLPLASSSLSSLGYSSRAVVCSSFHSARRACRDAEDPIFGDDSPRVFRPSFVPTAVACQSMILRSSWRSRDRLSSRLRRS